MSYLFDKASTFLWSISGHDSGTMLLLSLIAMGLSLVVLVALFLFVFYVLPSALYIIIKSQIEKNKNKNKKEHKNMNKKQIAENFEASSELMRKMMLRIAILEDKIEGKADIRDVSEALRGNSRAIRCAVQRDVVSEIESAFKAHDEVFPSVAETDGAGSVTLQELASLVIDGKPIKRVKTTVKSESIEVGAFAPKPEEEVEKKPA